MTALTQPATDQNRDNLAASMLIMLAMAVFTFEDYLLKTLAPRIWPLCG